MNSKLMKACLAGAAVIALAAGGSTYAAFSDFGDINDNTVGAGFLKLDLTQNGQEATALSFGDMAPNMNSWRTIWVASNNGDSVPDANLSLTFHNLRDQENGCSSNGEEAADSDCDTVATGELSRVLNFQTQYYPDILDPATCEAAAAAFHQPYSSIFPADYPSDLFDYASGAGSSYKLKNADGTGDLVLHPGEGVCIGIGAIWPDDAARVNNHPDPVDNAAQGDSLKFDVHFDLTQV